MKTLKSMLVSSAVAATLVAGSAFAGTLDVVKERGYVNGGVSGKVVGFSAPDANGEWTGRNNFV